MKPTEKLSRLHDRAQAQDKQACAFIVSRKFRRKLLEEFEGDILGGLVENPVIGILADGSKVQGIRYEGIPVVTDGAESSEDAAWLVIG